MGRIDVFQLAQRSISVRIPVLRDRNTLLAAVAGLVLSASSPILAQTSPAPVHGPISSAREGNIYDHQDHQPTEAEVSGAEAAAGIHPQSSVATTDVEKDVEELLKQIDELDKRSDEQAEGH
jgi:hypothetical protein